MIILFLLVMIYIAIVCFQVNFEWEEGLVVFFTWKRERRYFILFDQRNKDEY